MFLECSSTNPQLRHPLGGMTLPTKNPTDQMVTCLFSCATQHFDINIFFYLMLVEFLIYHIPRTKVI